MKGHVEILRGVLIGGHFRYTVDHLQMSAPPGGGPDGAHGMGMAPRLPFAALPGRLSPYRAAILGGVCSSAHTSAERDPH